MNKEQTITKLQEIIYTYENKTESNKLSEFAEGRLSAFRFSLNLIKNINFIHCCAMLKDKEALNFNSWLLNNGYMPYRDDLFIGKDKQLHFEDKLMQIYNEEVMNL